jgi:hypothetical protein
MGSTGMHHEDKLPRRVGSTIKRFSSISVNEQAKKYEFHKNSVLQDVCTTGSENVCRRAAEMTPDGHGMQ